MTCALALVLLMDVSGSVSLAHYDLQRQATAAALREAPVIRAAAAQLPLAIAVAEFGTVPRVIVPWHVLSGAEDLGRVADAIGAAPPGGGGGTHVGDALVLAEALLDAVPCAAEREVIDISGDGASNGGADPAPVVARLAARGTVVNGLPIVTEAEPDVAEWYRAHLITPGGRVFPAGSWADFARAIRAKLVQDIAGNGAVRG
jgi:hypothetical protein